MNMFIYFLVDLKDKVSEFENKFYKSKWFEWCDKLKKCFNR